MDDVRHPWWQVTGVFDPNETGSDFSYTEGLASRDLPEIHLWARPTLGEDPGLDWKLSLRDTARLLNAAAWRLIDGELEVGDSWEQSYDDGYVTARFSVHEPVRAEEVDAFGAGDAPVLPIKWELVRDPIGPPGPMTATDQAAAAATYAEIVDGLDRSAVAPSGWELPCGPSWVEDQRFGPRMPLVLARAAQVWQAEDDDLIDMLDLAGVFARFGSAGYATLVARAVARAPGRTSAVEQAENGARALLEGFGTSWGRSAHELMRRWMSESIDGDDPADQIWQGLHELLVETIAAFLVVEVVADLLPVRTQTWGQGVVLTSVGPAGVAPDRRWRCSDVVASAVTEMFATTPLRDLVAASVAWDSLATDERCWEIAALQATGSSHSPPVWELLDDGALRAAQAQLAIADRKLITLQQWANALATLLTYRPQLNKELVDTFVSAGQYVPSLAALVNAPLVLGRPRSR